MSLGFKYFRLTLTIVVISIFVFLAYKGNYYYDEPNEDGYCSIIMRGDFTGTPQTLPNSTGIWIGLTYLLQNLFCHHPSVDWYGLSLLLAYCLLLIQIARLFPMLIAGLKKIAGSAGCYLVLGSCAILFAQILLLWQFTTVSLLLSGFSLLKIWLDLRETEKPIFYRRSEYIFNVLCFVYAACVRSETAALNMVLWMPLMFSDYAQGRSFKKYAAFIPPVITIIAVSVFINIPFNGADSNYLAFRKYQFSFFDFKQPVTTLNLANQQDSMCYQAISTAFLSDTAKLNTALFKRIGLLPMDKTPGSIPYYFRNIGAAPGKINKACIKIISGSPGLMLFYFFCFFGGLLFVYSFARPKILWYLFFQLWPVFLVLGVTAFMKMENRVLVPIIWCALVQNLVWCYFLADDVTRPVVKSNALAITIFIFALTPIALDTTKTYNRWKGIKREEIQTDKLVEQINTRPEKIIAVNDNVCGRLCIRPFKPRYDFMGKQTVCLNYFQLFWLQGYGPYMQSVCGKGDLPGIVQALYQRKNEVIFVSKNARMKLIKDYFKVEYNVNLPYSLIETNTTSTRFKKSVINLYQFI